MPNDVDFDALFARVPDDNAFVLFANKEPVLLRTTWFDNPHLKRHIKIWPWNPATSRPPQERSYIDMVPFRRQ